MLMGRNSNLVNTVKPVYRQKLNLSLLKAMLAYTIMADNFQIQKP